LHGGRLTGDGLFAYATKVKNLVRELEIRWGGSYIKKFCPKKVFTDPIDGGKFKGAIVNRENLSKLIKEYYELKGWDSKPNSPNAK